ncbi:MAG: hypothetical protein J6V21_05050 [Alistipes sp.]|nr:hypothetical protein [Alistipes sp.]
MKIVAMLAVYLVWVCSNSVIALSCHANQSQHIHCCSKSCDCHHEGCEKIHFESPHGCNHDHSNKIALYDTIKENTNNIEPKVINITAQIEDNIAIEDVVSMRFHQHYQRKIPLPASPTSTRCGLRAPPVVA